jgi:hypothetical protein
VHFFPSSLHLYQIDPFLYISLPLHLVYFFSFLLLLLSYSALSSFVSLVSFRPIFLHRHPPTSTRLPHLTSPQLSHLLPCDFKTTPIHNMLSSFWLVSAMCALATAAPTQSYSTESAQPFPEVEALSAYFEALMSKVQAGKGAWSAPSCDLSNAVLPAACKYMIQLHQLCCKSQD